MPDEEYLTELDYTKGVVYNVRFLGPNYEEWLHKPMPNHEKTLKMFDNELLESLSRTPWYLVPLVWIPVITAIIWFTIFNNMLMLSIILLMLGMLSWIPVEYIIHRFLFHFTPKSKFFTSFHFMFHGIHHKVSNDSDRLVMPLLISVSFTLIAIPTISLIMGFNKGILLLCGFGLSYVWYDVFHYTLHHKYKLIKGLLENYAPKFLLTWFIKVKSNHLNHHFHNQHKDYGVTSGIMDSLMGTNYKAS